jgi:hypothetical protein
MPFDGADRDDDWNEVWSEYDHRLDLGRALSAGPAPARGRPTARRSRGRLLILLLAPLLLAFGIGLVAPSWVMAQDFAAKLRRMDGATLLQMADRPSLQRNLRQEFLPRAGAEGLSPAARTWLADMAGEMVEGWNDPQSVGAWLQLRRSPPLLSQHVLRSLGDPIGTSHLRYAAARLNYAGGIGFDLSWQDGQVRVRGLRFPGG